MVPLNHKLGDPGAITIERAVSVKKKEDEYENL